MIQRRGARGGLRGPSPPLLLEVEAGLISKIAHPFIVSQNILQGHFGAIRQITE